MLNWRTLQQQQQQASWRRSGEVVSPCTCRLLTTTTNVSRKSGYDNGSNNALNNSTGIRSRLRPPFSASRVVVGCTALSLFFVCYETRRWRRQKMEELCVLDSEQVWNEYYCNNNISSGNSSSSKLSYPELVQTVQRMGLMGKHKSVQAELDDIRKWHVEQGFKGGLILRDLTQPLFADEYDEETTDTKAKDENQQPQDNNNNNSNSAVDLEQRECYYLYYEIKGTGEIQQQLFCRGTTLMVDIWTCLQAWMVYDEDLGCRVHGGFRNQANRILRDVLPLLAPPTDRRATIHLNGHSLGGAVASILAVKLRNRGYRVTRLTTVGEPRLCASTKHAEQLARQLPQDAIRVEHELDFVAFLPPFGSKHRAGPKLWLLQDGSIRLVHPRSSAVATTPNHEDDNSSSSSSFLLSPLSFAITTLFEDDPLWWTDSVWINFLAWEVLSSYGRPHRIPVYVAQLAKLLPSTSSRKKITTECVIEVDRDDE